MENKKEFTRSVTMDKLPRVGKRGLERHLSFQGVDEQRRIRVPEIDNQESFRERKNKGPAQKRGDSPLHVASRNGNLIKVKEILLSGSNLNDAVSAMNNDGETPLYVAAENGQLEVIREILKHSDTQSAAIKAKNGFDAFHIAAREGHVDLLKELMSSFPDLAITVAPSNITALDTAATQGHINVVNLLLETNANLTLINRNNGKTVLHMAARQGHTAVVRALLAKEPGLNTRADHKEQVAIHMAVKGHNVDVVAELVRADPTIVNLEDKKGNTALHIATSKGRALMVKELLTVKELDINALNKNGETALDISQAKRNEEIAGLLQKSGAVAAADHANPPNPAKQLKKTVSDIKHDVHSQLQQTQRTGFHVHKIKKRLKKLHTEGLNNAINSSTVVAVLIATIAFAAIFTIPGEYVESQTPGYDLGEAYVATKVPFVIFFVSDALSLFLSLAVVVAQTSIVVIEHKAKKKMVFVINKVLWMACVFISLAFISLTYIVVGRRNWWLTLSTTVVGAVIMLTTLGTMCYCIVSHRMEQKSLRKMSMGSESYSRSDSDGHNQTMYAI